MYDWEAERVHGIELFRGMEKYRGTIHHRRRHYRLARDIPNKHCS